MRIALASLFAIALMALVPQTTPVNKKVVHVALAAKVIVADQPVAVTPTPQPQPDTQATDVQAPEPVVVAPPVTPTTHEELMAAAGISPADYGAVDYIVSHESGWNSDATEPTTGAHGLPQALPYSKTGCGWDDAVCQLEWANTYAISRYGGWWSAYDYWVANHNW